MNTISIILGNLGLSDKEATLYLTLLSYPQAKPAVLARKTQLSRATTYDVLAALQKKGMVYAVPGKATRTFSARDPRSLTKLLDHSLEAHAAEIAQQKAQLEQVLPELMSRARSTSPIPRIQYFEGKRGIQEALDDTLSTRDIIRAYADIGSIVSSMGKDFDAYLKRRVKKKIHARAIAPDTKVWRTWAKRGRQDLRDVRFMRPGSEYFPEINIYDDRVLMISWREQFAVLMTSRDFAHTQRVIFDELWDHLDA